MKKNAALVAIFALVSIPVLAAQRGGFSEAEASATAGHQSHNVARNRASITVKQAQNMPDDSWVTLQGNIVKRVDDDEYIFRDATGTMKVEIDDDDWHGLNVIPGDKVEIYGELDRDDHTVEMEVKQIRKIE